MEGCLQFHLDFAKGRDIVVWGTGKGSSEVIESLRRLGIEVKFFVSKECDTLSTFHDKPVYGKSSLNKNEVYVIDATTHYREIKIEVEELGFEEKSDFYSWYGILPYDRLYNGIPVGKCSYFPSIFSSFMGVNSHFNAITSIGRFTSINGSVQVHVDHSLKSISTGVFFPILGDEYENHLKKAGKGIEDGCYGRLEIGNDVWIGANVFINLSKVKSIGDGAIIGSGAVVIDDVPPYAIVVGVPAKVKKYRYSPEQIEVLKDVKWWEWSDSQIKENVDLLIEPELFFEKFAKK